MSDAKSRHNAGFFERFVRHCTTCGRRVGDATSHCPGCWNAVRSGMAFCYRCGAALAADFDREAPCPSCGRRLEGPAFERPFAAALFGFLLPGIAQIGLGRLGRGLAIFVVSGVAVFVTLGFAWPVVAIGSAIDCYKIAAEKRKSATKARLEAGPDERI